MGTEEKKTVKAVKVKSVAAKPKVVEKPAPTPAPAPTPKKRPAAEQVQKADKTPLYKKWWFWLIFAGLAITLIALLINGSDGPKDLAERVYVTDDQIVEMYTNPDAFKGQYVKLSGKLLSTPEQSNGVYAFQMWGDPENSERNTLVYTTDASLDLHEDDYVFVDGRITGTFTGENFIGGTVTAPQIEDAVVTKSNYIDVVHPTLKEISPNLNQDQRGFNVTVEKVEFAANQTRVYVTIKNNSSAKMSFGNYDVSLVVNGQQIKQKDDWDANLPELAYDILPGTSTSGVLMFPAVDQNQAFQLVIPDIYSDDWELDYDFQNMTFNIQP